MHTYSDMASPFLGLFHMEMLTNVYKGHAQQCLSQRGLQAQEAGNNTHLYLIYAHQAGTD